MDIQTLLAIVLALGSALYLIRKYLRAAKGVGGGGCGCGCTGPCPSARGRQKCPSNGESQ